ncbi:MAG TPA: hypothetical protein VF729_05825 [Solirubrobacterales bacterium]
MAALAAIAATFLVFAPAASAASDPLAGGATTIQLSQGFLKKAGKRGVKVLGLSPATVSGGTIALPVAQGVLDPLNGQGTISHAGEIKFKHGKRTARVGALVLDTATASLNGLVVGQPVKFASVEGLSFARNGFGVDLTIANLALTGNAAKLLNAKLGFSGKKAKKPSHAKASKKGKVVRKPFAAKQALGAAASSTQPLTVTILPTGKAKLAPDLGTVTKLFFAGATSEPIPPAELQPGPPPFVNLPIAGGVLAPNGSAGVLQTLGGEKLSKGSVTTITSNLWVDLGLKLTSAELEVTGFPGAPGKLGRVPNALLDLSAASVGSDPAARTVSVANAILRMSAEGAASLNQLYGTDFKAGDPLGSLSFTAQAQ